MFKAIIGGFAFCSIWVCVVASFIGKNLFVAIVAAMFANIFYTTFLFIEEDREDDEGDYW